MDLISKFNSITQSCDKFLSSGTLTDDLKQLLKHVYDFSVKQSRTSGKALPSLIIKGFDDEQIWQELELQNEDSLPFLINKVAKLVTSKNLHFPVKTTDKSTVKSHKKKVREKKVKQKSEAISSDEESDDEKGVDVGEDDFSDESLDSDGDRANKTKTVKIVPSVVDDKFFKLSEAEAFLDDQENDDTGLGVDLFNEVDSDSEEDRPMYGDFFEEDTENLNGSLNDDEEGQKENFGDEDDDTEVEQEEAGKVENGDNKWLDSSDEESKDVDDKKKVKFSIENNEFEYDSASDSSEDDNVKSSYEIREKKLRQKISELEDAALEEKPWTLKGEVSAETRPVNSLLEEVVEFDMTRRPAPIVTEETSNRLEDIIIRRIRDRAFSDVERKVKPVDTPNEFKKKLVLDQEKSKVSLAEVYEKEFLKQKGDLTQDPEKAEEEPEEHKIINNMMKSLFLKLDALTNFFFIPKPVLPDLKIVNNLPAVEVEEVAPTSTSDAKLLAPEEIGGTYRKSLISKEEKTKTDRKRERRKKKEYQARMYEKKKQEGKKAPSTYKEELKKALKFKNVSTLNETNDTKSKSSTDFFTKLQDEVKKPQVSKKRKNNKSSKSAKKLKL